MVKDGVAQPAQSLLWGDTSASRPVTLDDVFDTAKHYATFGDGNVATRFEVQYDERYDFVRSFQSDARETIADDEGYLQVQCFSTAPRGCRPILITQEQCRGAGGHLVAIGGDCENFSIGLVGSDQFCCRPYSKPSYDDITAEECRAAGGVERPCGPDTLLVGGSQTRHAGCCRTLRALRL